jgi:TatD DNase family protein
MYCDSHAHLESARFDGDRAAVIDRARLAGVRHILTCGSDLATSQAAVQLAAAWDGVYAAVGIHGHRAQSGVVAASEGHWQLDEVEMGSLRVLAKQPRVVALGELGLDYHYDFAPRDVQRAVLARQLALAAELNLPVILHNRESDADLRAIVEDAAPNLRGVLHCFLADAPMADWALARGLYLGVAGPITYANVTHLPPIICRAPRDRVLLETDCPYLAPHPRRGQRNEPSLVVHVAQRVAELWSLAPQEVGEVTAQNASRLFGWG